MAAKHDTIHTAQRKFIDSHLKHDVRLTKIRNDRRRRDVDLAYPTLRRFAIAELGFGRVTATIPVVDGEPGQPALTPRAATARTAPCPRCAVTPRPGGKETSRGAGGKRGQNLRRTLTEQYIAVIGDGHEPRQSDPIIETVERQLATQKPDDFKTAVRAEVADNGHRTAPAAGARLVLDH